MVRVSISNSELYKLNKNFEQHKLKVNQAANSGLKRVALIVLGKAQKNLKNNDSVVTGQLVNSGKVVSNEDFTVEVQFNTNYAAAYEFGRKSGKMPPLAPIINWIKKRGLSKDEKELKSTAFLIARKIGKFGTKPRPFLFTAMRDSENEMLQVLKEAIKKVL